MSTPHPDPDDRLGLNPASVTVGICTWVGVSVLLAVVSLRQTDLPAISLAAALGGTTVVALVMLPLRHGRSRASLSTCVMAVLGVAAVSATNAALVLPSRAETFALWFPGLVTGAIGGLAVRRRPVASLLAAASSFAALAWMLVVRLERPDWAVLLLVLCTPIVLWSAGGLVLSRLIDMSQIQLSRSRGELIRALGRRELNRSLAAARTQRQALLARSAIPLLEAISREGDSGRTWGPGILDQVEETNAVLRAEIRGRTLLDEPVRKAAERARRRGVKVSLLDDAPLGAKSAELPQLRHLITTALEGCTDGEITIRRPPAGVGLTVVYVGGPVSRRRLIAAVAASTETCRLLVEVTEDDDAVVLDVPS